MGTSVYINGEISGPEEARISVFDRGFLYGDSVYEVMRTSGGVLVDEERHLDRLGRSAASIALPMPKLSAVRAAVVKTMAHARNGESYVRIVITRGGGQVGLDTAFATEPTTLVIVKGLILPDSSQYDQGIGVRVVGVQRTSKRAMDPGVKSGNYLNNILALAEARENGDQEAIMCDRDGLLAEGASSNLFFWTHEGLCTPELSVGLLAGITRQRVLELATARKVSIHEGRFLPEALCSSSEAFITSSIRGIVPILSVNGDTLGASAPGPRTRQLMDDYAAFLTGVAENQR